mgnify:FL=1
MINKIKKRIKSFKAIPPKKNLPQAAVLIALTNEKDPKILYTLRSNKLSSHSGEVSFPGGKYEEGDENLVDTALRESHEEIGLKRSEVNILGSLDSMVSRFNISVTPFVGVISKGAKTNSDSEEIEVCFKVPLSFLLDDKRLRNDAVRRGKETFYVPAYSFKTYVIWGLTAMITVNFLNSALDAGIDLKNPAEILGEKE